MLTPAQENATEIARQLAVLKLERDALAIQVCQDAEDLAMCDEEI